MGPVTEPRASTGDEGIALIHFRDRAVERRALGFLAGRFSFKTWRSGQTQVPMAALPALVAEGLPFVILPRQAAEDAHD